MLLKKAPEVRLIGRRGLKGALPEEALYSALLLAEQVKAVHKHRNN